MHSVLSNTGHGVQKQSVKNTPIPGLGEALPQPASRPHPPRGAPAVPPRKRRQSHLLWGADPRARLGRSVSRARDSCCCPCPSLGAWAPRGPWGWQGTWLLPAAPGAVTAREAWDAGRCPRGGRSRPISPTPWRWGHRCPRGRAAGWAGLPRGQRRPEQPAPSRPDAPLPPRAPRLTSPDGTGRDPRATDPPHRGRTSSTAPGAPPSPGLASPRGHFREERRPRCPSHPGRGPAPRSEERPRPSHGRAHPRAETRRRPLHPAEAPARTARPGPGGAALRAHCPAQRRPRRAGQRERLRKRSRPSARS